MKDINKYVQPIAIGSLSGLMTVFLIYISRNLLLPIHAYVEKDIPAKSLVTTIVLLLVLLLSLSLYTYFLYKKSKTKLFLRFGVKWDDNLNPYCPNKNCESPLSSKGIDRKENVILICPICKEPISLFNDKGLQSSLDDAITKFNKGA